MTLDSCQYNLIQDSLFVDYAHLRFGCCLRAISNLSRSHESCLVQRPIKRILVLLICGSCIQSQNIMTCSHLEFIDYSNVIQFSILYLEQPNCDQYYTGSIETCILGFQYANIGHTPFQAYRSNDGCVSLMREMLSSSSSLTFKHSCRKIVFYAYANRSHSCRVQLE